MTMRPNRIVFKALPALFRRERDYTSGSDLRPTREFGDNIDKISLKKEITGVFRSGRAVIDKAGLAKDAERSDVRGINSARLCGVHLRARHGLFLPRHRFRASLGCFKNPNGAGSIRP